MKSRTIDRSIGIGLIALAAIAAVSVEDWAAAYYYQPLPTLQPSPQRALYAAPEPSVDFGPRSPSTVEELEWHKAIEMGPRRPSKGHLGTEGCPKQGYRLGPKGILVLSRSEEMHVSTECYPFRINKGGSFVVRKGAILSVRSSNNE